MMRAHEFMNRFMERLENDCFEKDNQPNNGPERDNEFVNNQIALYAEMLQTEVMTQVMEQM